MMANILTSGAVHAELADLDGLDIISDDAARTIASWWHGGNDHQVTALSHGMEWNPSSILDEIDALISKTREQYGERYSDETDQSIRQLNALRRWANAQVIISVWSSYGHQFMSDGDYQSCLTCGAEYELVVTPDGFSDGRYRAANGDDPTECPGDSREHGDPRESGHSLDCEDGCSRCDHDCNCLLCR